MPRRVGETLVVTTLLALCVPSLVGAQSAAQSGNVLIRDSFGGSEELPLVDHPPEVNRPGSAWVVSGTPGVVLRGQRAATDVGADAIALISAGAADVTVKADWIPGGPYGAVIFRATDVNNNMTEQTISVTLVR